MKLETRGEILFRWLFNYPFLIILSFICLYPMLYVVFASFSVPSQYMAHSGPLWRSLGFSTSSFVHVFQNPNVLRGYGNTLWILAVGIPLNMLLTILGAYFLSRKGVMLFKPVMIMIIFTMYFSGGLIPTFLLVRNLGLYDSRWAVILPGAVSTFNMIVLRTAMYAVPDSMEESAKIDGASHTRILFQIIVPLVKPTLAVLVLFYGVGHWNSWFSAMIYLRARSLYPLQLILREILVMNDVSGIDAGAGDVESIAATIQYALIIVATVPILALYPFLQRFFTKGIMIGALKG
jgi:putative aldouronate transport system permease protein